MKKYAEYEHLQVGDKFKALVEFEVAYKDSDGLNLILSLGEDSEDFTLSLEDYNDMMSDTHPMARKRKLEERKHQISLNRKKEEEELKQLEEELKLIEGV